MYLLVAAHSSKLPAQGKQPSSKTKKNTQVSRDSFTDVDAPFMPPALEVWAEALSNVARSEKPAGTVRLGYTFPDANIIAGSAANDARYLVTWLSRRAACMWRQTNAHFSLFSQASSQDWRSFLSRTLNTPLDSSGMPSPTAQALNNSQPEKISSAQRRKAAASKFFADMALTEMPDTVYWKEQAIATGDMKSLRESVDPTITTEVLWDLFEHNFRFELLALDRLLNPAAWSHVEQHEVRDALLRQVFFDDGGQVGGYYLFQGVPQENQGLAADNWQTRRIFVENLWRVMRAWPRPPTFNLGLGSNVLEAHFLRFESNVAQFYCQTFYNTFGRAANIPHRIKPLSSPVLLSG